MNRIICGVDVSKEWLDVHVWPAGMTGRFGNDASGIAELAALCARHAVDLVAMEASGGYERLAVLLLSELGQPCAAPLNARNVRRFAEAMGFLEKTDRIDAGVIAHYSEVRKVRPAPPPSPAQQRLKALVSRLSQVTGDLVANKQRRAAASSAETLDSIDEVIVLLKRQERRLHPTSLRSATFSHKGRRRSLRVIVPAYCPAFAISGSAAAALHLLPLWEKVAERSEVG